MTDIIDINAERGKRMRPDPEFVIRDGYGREMYCYTLSYSFDDPAQYASGDFTFRIWAYSWEDAEARLASIKASGRVDGQLYQEIT